MKTVEILEKIVQEASIKGNSKSILAVYREAFNSNDDIELFKLRALLMELMETSLESTQKSHSTLQTFNEVCKGLTYPNLTSSINNITPWMTNAHLSSVEAIFNLYKFKQDFDAMNEIETLNDELKEILKTEDITTEQKKIILEICYEIDNAIFEHKIIGNNAIKKLRENILSKIIINKDVLESIKNIEIKKKLGEIYLKIDTINKIMNTLISIGSKVIDLLPDLSI